MIDHKKIEHISKQLKNDKTTQELFLLLKEKINEISEKDLNEIIKNLNSTKE